MRKATWSWANSLSTTNCSLCNSVGPARRERARQIVMPEWMKTAKLCSWFSVREKQCGSLRSKSLLVSILLEIGINSK